MKIITRATTNGGRTFVKKTNIEHSRIITLCKLFDKIKNSVVTDNWNTVGDFYVGPYHLYDIPTELVCLFNHTYLPSAIGIMRVDSIEVETNSGQIIKFL